MSSLEQTLIDEAVRRALGGRIANLTTRTPAPGGAALPAIPRAGLLTDPETGGQYFLLDESVIDSDDVI